MAEVSRDAVMEASIKHDLDSLPKPHVDRSIYRVPEHVRNLWRKCYQPSVVSIGPYHHKNHSLKPSHNLKLKHLQSFLDLDSTQNGNAASTLGQYIAFIRQYENEARNYYAEDPNLSSEEFTKMLLIDAAFIINLFIAFNGRSHLENRIMMNKELLLVVQRDLFLQENQLPFFILERLYNQAFGRTSRTSFRQLTRFFISETFMQETTERNEFLPFPYIEASCRLEDLNLKHLLDFLRRLLLPSEARIHKPTKSRIDFPQSATHLKASGIRFKRGSKDKSLLDIKFKDGILEIPPLKIQAITEDAFRNIIFFELQHYDHKSYFMSYVFFIDELIDNPEDVQALEKSEIIDHWLGSDKEVASVFNRIAKNVSTHEFNFYYADICKELNEYADKRCNKWRAILRRQYFNHPWSTISVIYLVVLLILTVLQVIPGFLKN